jgi:magnesium chelatase subunit I
MKAKTLGELKKLNYKTKSIRTELRDNLISKLRAGKSIMPGIFGYDHTVIPDIERAILSGHNILFLGLRGQAKTRMARMLVHLLDDAIPIIEGSEVNDDPFSPISKFGKECIATLGDQTPIKWITPQDRFVEKLATPDVSIADLIGDLDPIKAAQKNISYDNEYAIHYGLIPRSNRSVFVINELSDLQARIQVALFNIRGFKLKLPLDITFVFTANPEDYTQRGNIITPLKDRIESQIITHYPEDIDTALHISRQESKIDKSLLDSIYVPDLMFRIIEQISFNARESEYIDEKSGVSARLSIAALELLYSAIQRRMIRNGEKKGVARLSDLLAIVPALTGKMELVYEGEQIGVYEVALNLINEAITKQAKSFFPAISNSGKQKTINPYQIICDWFSKGNIVKIGIDDSETTYKKTLQSLPDTSDFIKNFDKRDSHFARECILHIISGTNIIQREWMDQRIIFKDQLASMLNDLDLSSN